MDPAGTDDVTLATVATGMGVVPLATLARVADCNDRLQTSIRTCRTVGVPAMRVCCVAAESLSLPECERCV